MLRSFRTFQDRRRRRRRPDDDHHRHRYRHRHRRRPSAAGAADDVDARSTLVFVRVRSKGSINYGCLLFIGRPALVAVAHTLHLYFRYPKLLVERIRMTYIVT